MSVQPDLTQITGVGPSTRAMLTLATRARYGRLHIVLPDRQQATFSPGEPGPDAAMHIHHPRMARRFLSGGAVGFAEAYIDGDWSTPDLSKLLTFMSMNRPVIEAHMQGKGWYRLARRLQHAFRANTKSGSRRNIAAHYDLGNDFYAQWLDPTMTYSSAMFRDEAEDLATAQKNKYDRIADQVGAGPDRHLLEIGCGWGGFAMHVAKTRGAHVTSLTISQAQHDEAKRRVFEAGLSDKIDVRLQDYRDIDGQYDGIASIEMFEAVGEKYWPAFFGKVRDSLDHGGRAALQIITIDDNDFARYRRGVDFIQRYIFPGGMLPSLTELRRQVDGAGLAVEDVHGFGQCYAATLAEWRQRFLNAWPTIKPMGFDEQFRRMWEYYLSYCEAGFRTASIDVVQVALARR